MSCKIKFSALSAKSSRDDLVSFVHEQGLDDVQAWTGGHSGRTCADVYDDIVIAYGERATTPDVESGVKAMRTYVAEHNVPVRTDLGGHDGRTLVDFWYDIVSWTVVKDYVSAESTVKELKAFASSVFVTGINFTTGGHHSRTKADILEDIVAASACSKYKSWEIEARRRSVMCR